MQHYAQMWPLDTKQSQKKKRTKTKMEKKMQVGRRQYKFFNVKTSYLRKKCLEIETHTLRMNNLKVRTIVSLALQKGMENDTSNCYQNKYYKKKILLITKCQIKITKVHGVEKKAY